MRIAGWLCLCAAFECLAQELEPRAYSPNPVGTNFLVLGLTRSTGNVVVDASLPYSGVDAHVNAATVAYGHVFDLFSRSASATLALPYAWGDASGNVGEGRRETTRSGTADARLRLSMSLIGGPALSPQEFARRTPLTILGVSLTITPPTGQYDSSRLLNIGTNRWAFKPEIGVSHPIGQWYVEGYAGVWLFTANDEFNGHHLRQEDPVESIQGHVSYTIRPRLWVALDATYYHGGAFTVDNNSIGGLRNNSRIGLTVSVPLPACQSLKLSWSDGATTRTGTDFRTFGIAWQYAWFD